MTDVSTKTAPPAPPAQAVSEGNSSHAPSTGTQRSGWTTFAGIVLVVTGVARVFDSVWAFQYNRALPSDLQGALFGTSLNVYGWLWLFVGAGLMVIGLGLVGIGWLADSEAGRWIGVAAAGIGGIIAMSWIAFYPVWTVMYMALAVLVIYALIVHPVKGANR